MKDSGPVIQLLIARVGHSPAVTLVKCRPRTGALSVALQLLLRITQTWTATPQLPFSTAPADATLLLL